MRITGVAEVERNVTEEKQKLEEGKNRKKDIEKGRFEERGKRK